MRHHARARLTLVLLAAGLIGLVPAFAAAQADTLQLTAAEVFDPFGVIGAAPVGALTSPGTITCPGGEPTGNPLQPCPAGSRIQLRGVAGFSRMASASPLLAGSFFWEMDANWNADGIGPAWGTFRLELDAGGVWEGTWTNKRNKLDGVPPVWVGHASFVGRGTSGRVEGMQLRLTVAGATYTVMPLFWVEPIDAEILVPASR